MYEVNKITVVGRLHGDLKVTYNENCARFYNGTISVQRQSGAMDYLIFTIPVSVAASSGYDMPFKQLPGRLLRLTGTLRTQNMILQNRMRHITILYVMEIEEAEDGSIGNAVELSGTICRPPVYRQTPFGREICDFTLSVYRSRKNDFIPCIAWGTTAKRVSKMEVGQPVHLAGRFQSRDYIKKLENGVEETRTAYEVSAKNVDICGEEKRLTMEPEKEK